MYRSCTSGFVDIVTGFRELLGSDERELSRDLQACADELRGERECLRQAAVNLQIFRGELHECETLHRDAEQAMQDIKRSESQAHIELRAEGAARTAEMQVCKNACLAARREIAEAESQFMDTFARAMQCGREEGAAAMRAELAESSHSLRYQLYVAESLQERTAHEFAVEECKWSRHREEQAQEIAQLRNELACVRRQEDVVRTQSRHCHKNNKITTRNYLRGVDVARQECVHANLEARGPESNDKFMTANPKDGPFQLACDSFELLSDAVEMGRSPEKSRSCFEQDPNRCVEVDLSNDDKTGLKTQEWLGSELTVTTLMLKNIPCKLTRELMTEELRQLGLEGMHDAMQIPCRRNGSNLGYGFINFISAQDARRAADALNGHMFNKTCSTKRCQVTNATFQRREATLRFAMQNLERQQSNVEEGTSVGSDKALRWP
eukprot:TRINITY_DN10588_c1_g1_i1.p1 TRINITY_DN10588_c1_g1~~TRINITY_DN10588_c1_g1_i1.p1  ORF type:complete len:438 (+),score=62.03 TRINITY_DN10588_c1_g1_i1:3-1316(+)